MLMSIGKPVSRSCLCDNYVFMFYILHSDSNLPSCSLPIALSSLFDISAKTIRNASLNSELDKILQWLTDDPSSRINLTKSLLFITLPLPLSLS
mmetsp:Transcript_17420/g.38140  ORF Transcript_17420/g.38140 Transcript_17420/m.38140 type:complete len:94 (+) Transcript_17420:209-490(+)